MRAWKEALDKVQACSWDGLFTYKKNKGMSMKYLQYSSSFQQTTGYIRYI
jgi:hypothetical protein